MEHAQRGNPDPRVTDSVRAPSSNNRPERLRTGRGRERRGRKRERGSSDAGVDGGAEGGDQYRYRAFVSYSRNDETWARSLHRRLERFRIPRALRSTRAKRLGRLFLDKDELPASSDLGATLREALDGSGHLLLVLGACNRQTLQTREALAMTYKALGRTDEAISQHEAILRDRTAALGHHDPNAM
jgi:hypothetical protein